MYKQVEPDSSTQQVHSTANVQASGSTAEPGSSSQQVHSTVNVQASGSTAEPDSSTQQVHLTMNVQASGSTAEPPTRKRRKTRRTVKKKTVRCLKDADVAAAASPVSVFLHVPRCSTMFPDAAPCSQMLHHVLVMNDHCNITLSLMTPL